MSEFYRNQILIAKLAETQGRIPDDRIPAALRSSSLTNAAHNSWLSVATQKRGISAIRSAFELWIGPVCVNELFPQDQASGELQLGLS